MFESEWLAKQTRVTLADEGSEFGAV